MPDLSLYFDALKGSHGLIGLYSAASRVFFLSFGPLTALPALFFIDAPFGRWAPSGWLTVPGGLGWFVMEIISPLAFFLASISTPSTKLISFSSLLSSLGSFSLLDALRRFASLPTPRLILATCFLIHYANRSTLAELRNPGRSRMHVAVPLSAIYFNSMNGFLMGSFVGGGLATNDRSFSFDLSDGLRPNGQPLFLLGISLWAIGFLGNLYADEVLYNLKRASLARRQNGASPSSSNSSSSKSQDPKERYSIPHGFAYDWPLGGVSHPSYSFEWLEWTGFMLASTFALAPSPILSRHTHHQSALLSILRNPKTLLGAALTGKVIGKDVVRPLPAGLELIKGWYATPPALFLWAEVSTMLPRAVSGHRWYAKTFGKDWPRERKIVIPGVL